MALTDTQKTKLEGLKLKDLKEKIYFFQAIDRSILETILHKENSKQIWDSMKQKFQDSTKAKRQHLQALRSEFEMLRMKLGESISEFFSRSMEIVNKLWVNGEMTEDVIIVEKIFQLMTPKFNYVVCSIKESNDLDQLSIDELQGSLLVHEQKFIQQDKEEQALKALTDKNATILNQSANRGRGRGSRGN